MSARRNQATARGAKAKTLKIHWLFGFQLLVACTGSITEPVGSDANSGGSTSSSMGGTGAAG
ncbi:MAG TPA: hypothetical protein VLJ38_00245, partial [Polyangiaceae bacterium]|nr:hypothetical protein [Polyangiaceae bacterium]